MTKVWYNTIYKPLPRHGCAPAYKLVCPKSEVTLRCVDRVGYGEPAPGAGEEDWRGSLLVMGDQGPIWMSVTIQSGHGLQVSTKTQTPCTIMPQNRWTSLRYPDWESEDVSNKRDTEPRRVPIMT